MPEEKKLGNFVSVSITNVVTWVQQWLAYFQSPKYPVTMRVTAIEKKMDALDKFLQSTIQKGGTMADVLDQIKQDFEDYQGKVATTFADLQAKIAALTQGQLDPAKAQLIDDEIKAAAAALAPPAP